MINDPQNNDYWWKRSDLDYLNKQLHFAGTSCTEIIQRYSTPLYVYSKQRILENIHRLQTALDSTGMSNQLLFAMKSNRHQEILRLIANQTTCGIDACSPREVELAISCGFTQNRISVTSTAVSDNDWKTYIKYPEIVFNCDSIASIRRIAERGYKTKIGIRINPQVGVGYGDNKLLQYSGQKPTKFGIYPDRIDEAIQIAAESEISINGLHMHAGSGFTQTGLESYHQAISRIAEIAHRFDRLEYINIGGGLGVPLKSGDVAIDLTKWAQILYKELEKFGVKIYVEPGDHIVKDAGILLAEIVELEEKGGTVFAFVNAGFNLHPEPAFYQLPCEPVPLNEPRATPKNQTTIVGNINEALDVFNEDHPIELSQGDHLAFLNAGAYGASMSSNHCLRSELKEIII